MENQKIGYGAKPFIRAALLFLASLVICLVIGIISVQWDMFKPPSDFNQRKEVGKWVIMSLVIPHFLLFSFSVVSSFVILPLKKTSYTVWLIKQSIQGVFTTFLVVELITVLLIVIVLYGAPDTFYNYNYEMGMKPITNYFWAISLYSMSIPLWMGYRAGWKAYRQIGASTMQERYEEYLEELEVKNSGQFWERVVQNKSQKFFGTDGKKPRGGFLWFIVISPMVYTLSFSLSLSFLDESFFAPVISSLLTFFIVIIMSITKSRDVRKKKLKPYLIPVRDSNTVDEFRPEKSGVSVLQIQ